MCDVETGEVFLTAPKGTMRIQFKDDDVIPLVSFVEFSFRHETSICR